MCRKLTIVHEIRQFCWQSGTVITQLMSELDVSNNEIQEQQYQNRLESKAMRYFFRLKITCHNTHILKIYN